MDTGRLVAAHEGGELLVDDLDDLLGGGEAFHHLVAHGALGDLSDEALGHRVVDVGFQKGHAHFPHGGLDVRLRELAFAPQPLEHAAQALGKGFKCHCFSRPPSQSVMRRISSSIWSTSRSISALGE